MPRYTGVNHLALATGDMGKTIRFWRDLLGMRLVAGLGREGYRQYFVEISETDALAFFEWPSVSPVEAKDHGTPVAGPFAFDHVSIGVERRDDLWEIKDRLDAAGFWTSEVVDHGFIWSLYSFDPNNIAIEFSWATAEADLRRNPRMADHQRPTVGLEGPDPQPGHWPAVDHPTPREQFKAYPGEGRELVDQG